MAKKMNNFNGKEWLQNSFSIWRDISKTSEERKLKHPAMFPQQLVEKLIKIYTKDSGEVILDPFLGIGSTLKAAHNLGKKGIGFDLNKEYCTIAKNRVTNHSADELFDKKLKRFEPKIYCEDSRNILKHVKPNSVDLVVTSPPYWDILNMKRTVDNQDIKKYSESKKDLGNISDYEKFLSDLKEE